jgi:nitrogen fixation NifU-like protein
MSLRELYQEMIIDHGRTPRNFGVTSPCTHSHKGHNPLCGDKLTVYVTVKDNKIEAISFDGEGCEISVASASLMTEAVKQKSLNEFNELFNDFHGVLAEGKPPTDSLGKLAVFTGVAEFPMRVKCATLAWHTLKAALDNTTDVVTTENEE